MQMSLSLVLAVNVCHECKSKTSSNCNSYLIPLSCGMLDVLLQAEVGALPALVISRVETLVSESSNMVRILLSLVLVLMLLR